MKRLFFEYSAIDVFKLLAIPRDAELNVADLISCSKHGDPTPKKDYWIPPDRYVQRFDQGKVEVQINSRFSYKPKNKDDIATSFLASQAVLKLEEGVLRYRVKRDIDLIACLSLALSIVALFFTGVQYRDQKNELELSKSPVWATKLESKEKWISFNSPNQDLQIQHGYLGFNPRYGIREKPLYMPGMKADLENYLAILINCYSKAYRDEEAYILGANRIFDTVALTTQFTYKGEVRSIGQLYRLYFDVEVPAKGDSSPPSVKLLGTSFLRFFEPGENLESALLNEDQNGETESQEWRTLIYNPAAKFVPKSMKIYCSGIKK